MVKGRVADENGPTCLVFSDGVGFCVGHVKQSRLQPGHINELTVWPGAGLVADERELSMVVVWLMVAIKPRPIRTVMTNEQIVFVKNRFRR